MIRVTPLCATKELFSVPSAAWRDLPRRTYTGGGQVGRVMPIGEHYDGRRAACKNARNFQFTISLNCVIHWFYSFLLYITLH